MPTSSQPVRRGGLRRQLTALLSLTLALGTGAVVAAMPAAAAPAKPGHVPTRQLCAPTNQPGYARCFGLARTDIAARPHGVQPNDTPDGYAPADLQDAYQLPSSAAGAGQTVGIVDAFDDPDAEADLAVYRAQYGLPPCTTANGCFKKVNQEGNEGPYPDPDPGWAGEIAIDIDMVSAACPNCHIVLVETDDNFDDNLAAGVDTAVSLGAKFVSNSYGGDEDPSQTGLDSSYNHPGIAVTASTGDSGYGASYPATAPGVTAVGGTALVQDGSARGWSETAWDGAGSGCSEFTPKPAFQHDPDCDMKADGDVSAVADPATGVAVYNAFSDGGWTVYGGTSVASPIIAATYALAGTPVAGSNPESYPYKAITSLNDVTSGSNGSCGGSYLCTAGPGYDGPTGLGTPKGVNAFRSGPHGTIKGTVRDSATHDPVANATITVGENVATTAGNGTYRLSVPTGTYDLTAAAYGYRVAHANDVAVAKNDVVTKNFALHSVPSRTVSGTVTDGSGHHWPLYAKITVAGYPGGPIYTNPFTGKYSVSLPSGQNYHATVDAVSAGYASKTVTVNVASTDVTKNVALAVLPSCTAPGYYTKYSGLVERFDTVSKPAGWTVTDNNDSGGVWVFDDPDNRGNQTGGTGNFAIIDSDFIGPDEAQNTDLISPSVDLSADPAPVVGLNSYYKSFLNSVVTISYTVDGGTTWNRVWKQTDEDQQGPLKLALPLAANQSNVQVRFHFSGEFAYYWEVDDVYIGHKSCATVPGGLVAGFVRDDNTDQPVNGASVKRADHPADATVTKATPNDPGIPDGFYELFSTAAGSHPIVASKSNYANSRATVAISSNSVTRKDFRLPAGRLSVSTTDISRTVTLRKSASAHLTLHNTGTRPVQVDLGEQPGTFQIGGQPARASYAGVTGAPTHRVAGHYSPLRASHVTPSGHKPSAVPSDAPWQDVTDYPTAISDNTASSNDGQVYSLGGIDGDGDFVASMYRYDPSTTSWTQLADMNDVREAPTSNWVGGKLFVTGGWDEDGATIATTQAYDPGSNTWTTVADNPKPHAGSGNAVLDGKLYVVGGCDDTCGNTDVEVYDPASDSWSDGPAYPEDTSWIACGGIDTKIFCAGGTNDSGSSASTYALDGGSWTQVADMPVDDWAAASSVANGQLVVSGGAIEGSTVLTNEGWSYDPGSDSWTALPNSNNSYYRLGGACGFYKVGGSVGNFESEASVELLPGYDQCGSAGADVTWLSESPASVTVGAGQSASVAVSLNSRRLAQPGTYTAQLTFSTDTPYTVTPVDVTFTVEPPASWGKIFGKVSGRACDGSVASIPGATVQVNGFGGNHTLTTGADGTYALWLDQRADPLTLIAAKDGWKPQTRKSGVTPGAPQRENFTLAPSKSCS